MSTKSMLLSLLEANKETYLSGEFIAGQLGISRTAVWKAVKALEKDGYTINAVKNKGYSLSTDNDIISSDGIQKYLSKELKTLDITVLETTSSTNQLAKEKAETEHVTNSLIIANEQSLGRGRSGRSFFSPKNTGIYMSLLLNPEDMLPEQAISITTMAAVAMCQAIEAVSDKKAQIKWVNDIFVDGKKVCGILTEGSFSMENGRLLYAVLGIGVNIYTPEQGFPGELSEIAGSILNTHEHDIKNRLISEFLNSFYRLFKNDNKYSHLEEYRRRSLLTGKTVLLSSPQGQKHALVTGIDDSCRLMVRYEDGTNAVWSSGEVNILKKNVF